MKTFFAKGTLLGMVAATALLVGCGGGGGGGGTPVALTYTGNTDPALIDSSNAQALGASVAENTSEAINAETTGGSNPFGVSLNISNANSPLAGKIAEISRQILTNAQNSNQPVGITYSYNQLNAEIGGAYFCGGSVSITDSLANGSSQSGTITFSDLCFDINYVDPSQSGNLVMNGSVYISTTATTETTTYSNFTVSYAGETYTFSGTEVCSTSYPYDCSTLFEGGDGKTYMVSDLSVTGDDVSGYSISATFFNPTYGSVSVTTSSPITFCPAGHPNGGTVNITGASGTYASITFRSDCTGYDGDYYDGTSTGTFSGDWV
jgi:hypothetical protein